MDHRHLQVFCTLGGSGGGTFGLIIVLDLLENKKTEDLIKLS